MNYCAGWIRQQENQQLGIPLATRPHVPAAAAASCRLRHLQRAHRPHRQAGPGEGARSVRRPTTAAPTGWSGTTSDAGRGPCSARRLARGCRSGQLVDERLPDPDPRSDPRRAVRRVGAGRRRRPVEVLAARGADDVGVGHRPHGRPHRLCHLSHRPIERLSTRAGSPRSARALADAHGVGARAGQLHESDRDLAGGRRPASPRPAAAARPRTSRARRRTSPTADRPSTLGSKTSHPPRKHKDGLGGSAGDGGPPGLDRRALRRAATGGSRRSSSRRSSRRTRGRPVRMRVVAQQRTRIGEREARRVTDDREPSGWAAV